MRKLTKYKQFLENFYYKTDLGFGRRNKVFDFISKEEKVIKVGSDIKQHSVLFGKRPDIFPILYKISENYLILEKLDTEKIKEDFKELLRIYNENMITHYEKSLGSKFTTVLKLNSDILDNIIKSGYDYGEYQQIIDRLNYIIKNVINLYKELGMARTYFDLNPANFGYDKNGILKALDY